MIFSVTSIMRQSRGNSEAVTMLNLKTDFLSRNHKHEISNTHESCIEHLRAYLYLTWHTMASSKPRNWIIRGPPCNICMINLGDPYTRIRDRLTTPEQNYIRLHHPNLQTICFECTQGIFDERHRRWWQEVFRGHSILVDSAIQSRISKYLWLSMNDTICLCGKCDPFWLSREGRRWGCPMDMDAPGESIIRTIEAATTITELAAACKLGAR